MGFNNRLNFSFNPLSNDSKLRPFFGLVTRADSKENLLRGATRKLPVPVQSKSILLWNIWTVMLRLVPVELLLLLL